MPEWLGKPADPMGSMAKGIQAGATLGRSFMQARQQRHDMQQDDALMPIRQQMAEYELKSKAIDIEVGLQKQQDTITNKQGFAELGRTMQEISVLNKWDGESESRVWGIGKKYPSLLETDQFKYATGQFDKAQVAARMEMAARTRQTQVENQSAHWKDMYTLGSEKSKNDLTIAQDKITSAEKLASEANASRESMNSEKMKAMLEGKRLEIENKGYALLPKMAARKFSEEVRSIFKDPDLDPDQRERKANRRFDEEVEKIRKMEGGSAPVTPTEMRPTMGAKQAAESNQVSAATNGVKVRVKSPDGKIGYIPTSQVKAAEAQGYIRQ